MSRRLVECPEVSHDAPKSLGVPRRLVGCPNISPLRFSFKYFFI